MKSSMIDDTVTEPYPESSVIFDLNGIHIYIHKFVLRCFVTVVDYFFCKCDMRIASRKQR